MAKCDYKLAASIELSCDAPIKKGVKNTGVIINFDDVDWDKLTYDETNPNIVKTLVLKTGAKAYSVYIPGNTPFTGTNKALVVGTYRNKFTKQVHVIILDNGAEVSRKVIDQLANGRFVVILENNYQGATHDNAFEIYGLETGLSASEMSDDKYSEDTDGGWAVTLEETDAPTSGLYFLDTDIETTRAALNSLLGTTAGE